MFVDLTPEQPQADPEDYALAETLEEETEWWDNRTPGRRMFNPLCYVSFDTDSGEVLVSAIEQAAVNLFQAIAWAHADGYDITVTATADPRRHVNEEATGTLVRERLTHAILVLQAEVRKTLPAWPSFAESGDYYCRRCDRLTLGMLVRAARAEMEARRCLRCRRPMEKVP
jgi:hypothetical protein